jgi:heme-degrading monooxygenase HmoA
MPVTELALLHLKNHRQIPPETKSALVSGASAQARFAGYPVRLYSQVEDPSYIYLLGGWDSVSQHMNEWIPSPTNQNIMSSLADEMEVVWMFHVEVEPASGETCSASSPLDAPVLAIERCFVGEEKGDFEDSMARVKGRMEECTAPRMLRCGWRIDHAEGREEMHEFVVLSGWEDMEDHLRFLETGSEDDKYRNDRMEGVELRHARLMEVV